MNDFSSVGVEVALVRAFFRGTAIDASDGRLKLILSDGFAPGVGVVEADMTVLAGPRGVVIVCTVQEDV